MKTPEMIICSPSEAQILSLSWREPLCCQQTHHMCRWWWWTDSPTSSFLMCRRSYDSSMKALLFLLATELSLKLFRTFESDPMLMLSSCLSRTNMSDFICIEKKNKNKKYRLCVWLNLLCDKLIYDVLKVPFLGQLAPDGERRQSV